MSNFPFTDMGIMAKIKHTYMKLTLWVLIFWRYKTTEHHISFHIFVWARDQSTSITNAITNALELQKSFSKPPICTSIFWFSNGRRFWFSFSCAICQNISVWNDPVTTINFCGYCTHWELKHTYIHIQMRKFVFIQVITIYWCCITTVTMNIPVPYISLSSSCMRLVLHKYNPADQLLSGLTMICCKSPYLLRELVSILRR